jgi:hypothetical protein
MGLRPIIAIYKRDIAKGPSAGGHNVLQELVAGI